MPLKEIGILMVATNAYLSRWQETVLSLERNSLKDVNTRIYLFTNRIDEAATWAKVNLQRFELEVYPINGWGWPEATLHRYEVFNAALPHITEEILMYLDSDMEIRSDFSELLNPLYWKNGIALVAHPGYQLPAGVSRLRHFLFNPRKFVRWMVDAVRNSGAQGAWETRSESMAFVPRRRRHIYVHGAIWFGRNSDFGHLCRTLSERVRIDLENGVIAVWHDESHLNWYHSIVGTAVLDGRFSGIDGYRPDRKIDPFIVSVEKRAGEGRDPSEIPIP